MRFEEAMQQVAQRATVRHAQDAIRHLYGRRATHWVAEQAGISLRSAQRWMSSKPPVSRQQTIRDLAGIGATAAQRIRSSSGLNVGRVRVRYRDEDHRTRTPREFTTAEIDGMDPVYDALYAEDFDVADYLFSNAMMNAYEQGLQETLTISEFETGIVLR